MRISKQNITETKRVVSEREKQDRETNNLFYGSVETKYTKYVKCPTKERSMSQTKMIDRRIGKTFEAKVEFQTNKAFQPIRAQYTVT